MSGLADIKARLAAITPGPWLLREGNVTQMRNGRRERIVGGTYRDSEFIAHAPVDIAKLVAALEAVEGLCEQGFMMSPEQIRQSITEAVA